jgi:2,4-dienoyl-CoA reductase-like NADH-dependent reductase (Old Yellow Enzyme family)
MSKLFDAYNLAGTTLSNRIVMAPMTRSRAVHSIPDDQTARYYAQRASAGLIVTEGSQISIEGRGYLFTPGIHTDEQIAGWRKVTDEVHERGGRMFVQLWHVGRISHVTLQQHGAAPVSSVNSRAQNATAFAYDAAGVPNAVPVSTPRALTIFEIGHVIADFVRAAQNALTFLLETVDAVTEAIGSAKTGIRLSPFGRLHDMPAYFSEESDWLTVARELSSRDIAYIHLSDQQTLGETAIEKSFVQKFRDAYAGTLILAGGFDKNLAEQAIESGIADLIAFGRPYISNPDLVERFRNAYPLAPFNRSTFYGGSAEGYTDYPSHETTL